MTLFRNLLISFAALAATAFPASAIAQAYPVRPVRIVVPYVPGAGTTFTSRTVAAKLSSALGQSFVIDNRGGANGLIGSQIVRTAPPDGYTILWTDNAHNVNPLVYKDANYDPLKEFETIAQIATNPEVLIAAVATPVNTFKELLALPKSQTATYAIGTSGLASVPHLTYERLRLQTGLTLNHVPYKGGGAALADLVAGQIPFMFSAAGACTPLIQAGKIKAFAVAAKARLRQVPDVPTFDEIGVKGFVADVWYGAFAPKGTPRAIVAQLSSEIAKALASPDVADRFTAQSLEVAKLSPEDFKRQIATETANWKLVIQQTGLKIE